MSFGDFENAILALTERMLVRRKRRALLRRRRSRNFPSAVLEWAATVIIIILAAIAFQMFFFQNYRIPTSSMFPTLKADDLIVVEKITFGPEILPGALKFPALRPPRRGEVVSFESELYARKGPLAELLDRFVYFITLSLVNLKTDAYNDPIVDLLIKRVVGLPGDRIRCYRGRFEILPACEDRWVEETEMAAREGVSYRVVGETNGRRDLPGGDERDSANNHAAFSDHVLEAEAVDIERSAWERKPYDRSAALLWLKKKIGWYIPAGMFFPMGDNRPNSRDARVYGPVSIKKIEGRALLRFYPFNRCGVIE